MNEQMYVNLINGYNDALIRHDISKIRLLNQRLYEEEFERYSELISWRRLSLKNDLDNNLINDIEDCIKITLGRLERLMNHAVILAQQENKSDEEEK